jgi:transposase-like protein
MELITRSELAQELRVCTATLDNWRREYELQTKKKFPGEVRLGLNSRAIRFNKKTVFNFLNNGC